MDGSKRLPKNIEVDEPAMCFLCKAQFATMSEYQAFVSCSKVSPNWVPAYPWYICRWLQTWTLLQQEAEVHEWFWVSL